MARLGGASEVPGERGDSGRPAISRGDTIGDVNGDTEGDDVVKVVVGGSGSDDDRSLWLCSSEAVSVPSSGTPIRRRKFMWHSTGGTLPPKKCTLSRSASLGEAASRKYRTFERDRLVMVPPNKYNRKPGEPAAWPE